MTENVLSVTRSVWALCRKRLQYPVSSRVLYRADLVPKARGQCTWCFGLYNSYEVIRYRSSRFPTVQCTIEFEDLALGAVWWLTLGKSYDYDVLLGPVRIVVLCARPATFPNIQGASWSYGLTMTSSQARYGCGQRRHLYATHYIILAVSRVLGWCSVLVRVLEL